MDEEIGQITYPVDMTEQPSLSPRKKRQQVLLEVKQINMTHNTVTNERIISDDGTVRELTLIDLFQFAWKEVLVHRDRSGLLDCCVVFLDRLSDNI